MAKEAPPILLYLKGDESGQPIGTGTVKNSPLFKGVSVHIQLAAEFNSSGIFAKLERSPLNFAKAPELLRLVLRNRNTGEPIRSLEELRQINQQEKAKQNND